MAWPYDARDFTFQNGLYVPSSTLNEIQDRIIDLHADRTIVIRNAESTDNSGNKAWQHNSTQPENGWIEIATGRIYFFIELPNGAVLNSVYIKFYNGGGGASTAVFTIYQADCEFDSASTAPTEGSSVGSISFTNATTTWDVQGDTGLAVTASDQKIIYIESATTSGSDKIAGVLANYTPLTATP